MRQILITTIALTAILFLNGCASPERVERRNLHKVVQSYTEAIKHFDPYYAPMYSVEEDLAKFGDYLSPEYLTRAKAIREKALTELTGVREDLLSSDDRVLYRLLKRDLEIGIEYYKFPFHLSESFTQLNSRFREFIDDSSPALTSFPFDSAKHYWDFVKRADGFPAFVDRQIAVMNESIKGGYHLNCTIAKNAINSYKEGLATPAEKNPFYRPAIQLPASISSTEQARIRAAYLAMVTDTILPAFQKFDRYYQKDYLPKCRKAFGTKSMPDSARIYAHKIRANTDLDLTPEEIHKTGLAEVGRILQEFEKVRIELKIPGTTKEFIHRLAKDPQYFFTSAKDMFASFDAYRAKIDQEIPKYFSLIPKSEFRLAESENPEDPAASYRMPTDYQPFGRFVVNTHNLKGVPKYGVETLYLHEAIPGHHFQLALQYELRNTLTEYQRKIFNSNAFAEGWALYVEKLGREAGWISSPLQMAGSLSDEMLRAARLVVDTGIHHYGWSRDKAIRYMQDHLAADIRDIRIEADRYSVWPGQALGYKVGQLKILELRDFAKAKLGDKFDIKEFHRTLLEHGAVSMPVLESTVHEWVARTLSLSRR